MNKINRVIAIVCFFLSIALYLAIPSQVNQASSTAVTLAADFFPGFIAILLFVSSIGLFVQSEIAIRQNYEAEEGMTYDWGREVKVVVVFVMMILYVLAMRWTGFLIASFVFGVALLWTLKVRTWWYYVVYAACVLVVYYVFTKLLYVYLPTLDVWIF